MDGFCPSATSFQRLDEPEVQARKEGSRRDAQPPGSSPWSNSSPSHDGRRHASEITSHPIRIGDLPPDVGVSLNS